MASSTILLRGGIVLIHDANDHVVPTKADILIQGNMISKIAPNIQPVNAKEYDCTDKIICPGFIDTHHHLWQTLLKGRFGDQLLLDYMCSGNAQSSNHTAEDVFWGQLGGCMESVNVGTTTVVDHAHMTYSSEHPKAAVSATVSSGIRSVYCYDLTGRVESWAPFKMFQERVPAWIMDTLIELAGRAPFGNGRVQLGFAFDAWYLPKETVISLFEKVKDLGIQLITTHQVRGAIFGHQSVISQIDSYGLLNSSLLISHASNIDNHEAELIKSANSYISCTPSTELQMAMGYPNALSEKIDITHNCSLGIDLHASTTASIPNEMRLLLQTARATHNQKFVDANKAPSKLTKTVEDVFNLGTIAGARALGMDGKVGTLKEGAFADIVVFDGLSPAMCCAAQKEPVAAVVLHSSPEDIEMVIIDGVVRKENKQLVKVDVTEGKQWTGKHGSSLAWNDVARELVTRARAMDEKIKKLDLEAAKEAMTQQFYINKADIIDDL